MKPVLKNNGSGLEATIIASQGRIVILEQFRAQLKFLRGGKTTPVKGPVDFAGTIVATGRSIWFDAKSSAGIVSLNASPSHFAPHQRLCLIRQGECGAVAGLLCEATAHESFYWLPWYRLTGFATAYHWAEMIRLNSSKLVINFAHLIAMHDLSAPSRKENNP